MLLNGIDHVAVLTKDTDRLAAFYRDVFEADIEEMPGLPEGMRLTFFHLGAAELNVFEIADNAEADRQVPMFGRGRLDHLGLRAADLGAFEEIRRRLLDRGACDEFVTDFGPVFSLFFTDPDGLEGEVLVANPDAAPGLRHPPGTPAARFVAG